MSMKIRVGICGLANVGKSTLYNALVQKSLAQAGNFPFCTIEPNRSPIAVPDEYLHDLGTLANSKRTVPAAMEWVDVAGLIKNAHRGEGLGNRFLATLRECDAICHLIRTFEDKDIVHVDGKVNPVDDAEVVNLELLLADLAHVERRLEKTTCRREERAALEAVGAGLRKGIPARAIGLSEDEVFSIKSMGLLTLKPVLYAFNVDEVDFTLGRSEALASAEKICGASMPALMMAKEAVNRAYETTLSEGLRFERRMFHALFATEDQNEGMTAFAEKRKANFQDR